MSLGREWVTFKRGCLESRGAQTVNGNVLGSGLDRVQMGFFRWVGSPGGWGVKLTDKHVREAVAIRSGVNGS